MINSIGGQFQKTLHILESTSKKESKLLNKLATGKKLNTASDDVVALGRVTELNSKIRGINVSQENASFGSSLLGTASGGLNQQVESLQRLRELAVQAADGNLSNQDRENLTNSANEHIDNINQIAQDVNVDGNTLLDGTFSANMQIGPDNGNTLNVSIEASTSESLGVSNIDLSTPAGASNAIDTIDDAIASATANASRVGSAKNRLDSVVETNSNSRINFQKARSVAEDLDFAEALGAIKSVEIQKSASSLIFASITKSEKSKLSFLA